MSKNYVDNNTFLELLRKRKIKNDERGEPYTNEKNKVKYKSPVRVSEELGSILYNIAHNLSYKMNFINYTFREEMVSDAVENCLLYIDNFDPEIGVNPFAYFTQICYFAFVRRIQKEGKQTEIKEKLVQDMDLHYDTQEHDSDGDYHNTMIEFTREHLYD